MPADMNWRVLRAILRNAAAWGVAFAALAVPTFVLLKLVGVIPATVPWWAALVIAVKISFWGAVAGTAFATAIRVGWRGRRLADISALRFALVGGLVTAIAVPLVMQLFNIISGAGPVPWSAVGDDALFLGAFGALAAGASMRLAQHAESLGPGGTAGELDLPDDGDRLPAAPMHDRARR